MYIDGTPQNAKHCSAKYIPMTAERCIRSAKYIPMTAERCTSSAKYILMTEERCTRTAKYILMTAERSTLYCEPLMVFTGTHEPCSVLCGKRRALIGGESFPASELNCKVNAEIKRMNSSSRSDPTSDIPSMCISSS